MSSFRSLVVLLVSIAPATPSCKPVPVDSKAPRAVPERAADNRKDAALPIQDRVIAPEETLENACDAVCSMVGQRCHGELKGSLANVTRCVKACTADRLSDADRQCYISGAKSQDRARRHHFCSTHQLAWPRLRPGGCVPPSSDGWVATRKTNQPCDPGFTGERRYPVKGGQTHFAYCDAAGLLRVMLQREVVTTTPDGPTPIRHIARSETHLAVFHARQANCGAVLRLAIVDLARHRSTVREIALNLGRKRWAARLGLKADHALIEALDRSGRTKDWVRVPLKPDRVPAISDRCVKLRHKLEHRVSDDPDTHHPCLGAQSSDPDHCG
jgi:hypothetical protein